MNPFTLGGRILLAIPFFLFGLMHFAFGANMAGMVPAWLPGGVFWVYATGAALVAGAIGMTSGKLGYWAALGLAALMAVFVVTVHLPGLGNPETQQMAMAGALKDLGLAGGALIQAGLFRSQRAGATQAVRGATPHPARG